MLTPEQSRLRIHDDEMRALKKENTELKDKLSYARKAMAAMLREAARHGSWRDAAEYRRMADELEAS